MPESVTTADGKPLDLDAAEREFAAAMAAPPADDGIPAPPVRKVPTDQADKPADRAKPAPRAKPAKKVRSVPPPKADYTEDTQTLVSTVWTVAASLPPTQPLAYVINSNADQLTAALAEGARHNETIRSVVSGGSEHSWKIGLALVGVNVGLQTLQLMRDPALRQQAAEATQEQIKSLVQSVEVPEQQNADDGPDKSV